MKILIKVTKEIIEKSMYCGFTKELKPQSENCAIALAIKELFPNAVVGYLTVALTNSSSSVCIMPARVEDFIRRFDNLNPQSRLTINPISFEIDVPNEVINQIGIGQVYKVLSESKTLEHVN